MSTITLLPIIAGFQGSQSPDLVSSNPVSLSSIPHHLFLVLQTTSACPLPCPWPITCGQKRLQNILLTALPLMTRVVESTSPYAEPLRELITFILAWTSWSVVMEWCFLSKNNLLVCFLQGVGWRQTFSFLFWGLCPCDNRPSLRRPHTFWKAWDEDFITNTFATRIQHSGRRACATDVTDVEWNMSHK